MSIMNWDKFSRLFHIASNLMLLVKKLDVDGTQAGYIENMKTEVDSLFLSAREDIKETDSD